MSDVNNSESLDDDKLDGMEYPPERPMGIENPDRDPLPEDLAEEEHLGTLVAPGGDGGDDLESDAVASEARGGADPLGLDRSAQDLEEVRPAEEEAMHITEAPPMGDGDGYVD
jgi:hypothetical protein